MSQNADKTPDHGDAEHEGAAKESTRPNTDKSNPANSQDEMGKRLDEGLDETFPSSDPVSVKITK